ncbi:flagellar hook-associated protein 2 [Paenisporosarcina quisquiliarum]|uniref:flagellar hook-associated protein 2 n=1 Tax=Paenisporosarcina quisquiliarum TaxID=365346 RepID=UPI003736E79A
MRITGLASGLDTETMIKDMMKVQRMPIDKILQKKQYMEWQRDDYRTVNRQLFDFKNLISDSINREATYIQKTVTSSDPNSVKVRNIISTEDFTGSIKVDQLATQANMRSTVSNNISDTSKTLTEIFGISGEQKFSIQTLISNSNGTTSLGTAVELKFDPATTSLDKVLSEISSKTGVSAFYDSFTGRFALTADESGNNASGNEIVLNDISGTFLTGSLKLSVNNWEAANIGYGTEGKNAKFSINGLATERAGNTFQISGYEVSLFQTTSANVTFTSSTDTQAVLDKVVKFVDEYNKLIEGLNKNIRQKNYRDFQPLSTEQKKDLSDKEIELWEEKAKSGTLRNDSIISSTLNTMRSILNQSVTTSTGSVRLNDIGISTSNNYSENGKLIIDEGKLRAAISDNPNKIYELFSTETTGLGEKLVKEINESRDKIVKKAGTDSSVNNSFSLGRTLNGFDSQITRFEARLQMVETRYYRQFGAMEAAIQRANQQSAYLMNSFGGGQ